MLLVVVVVLVGSALIVVVLTALVLGAVGRVVASLVVAGALVDGGVVGVVGATVVVGTVPPTDCVMPFSPQPEVTSTMLSIPTTHRNTKPPKFPLTRCLELLEVSLPRGETLQRASPPLDRLRNSCNAAPIRQRECPPVRLCGIRNIVIRL
ncbi:MAG: hypothetical protein KTU85_00350 [Acidimicrobiia bacterium]|nr:hypothetical protein [Acidimicrobiia bacterium]